MPKIEDVEVSEMDQGDTVSPHTPLPWRALPNRNIVDRRGHFVANVQLGVSSMNTVEMDANAAFICRAVNSHPLVVEALEAAQVFAEAVLEMHGPDHAGLNLSTLNKIVAALSAANGET